ERVADALSVRRVLRSAQLEPERLGEAARPGLPAVPAPEGEEGVRDARLLQVLVEALVRLEDGWALAARRAEDEARALEIVRRAQGRVGVDAQITVRHAEDPRERLVVEEPGEE